MSSDQFTHLNTKVGQISESMNTISHVDISNHEILSKISNSLEVISQSLAVIAKSYECNNSSINWDDNDDLGLTD